MRKNMEWGFDLAYLLAIFAIGFVTLAQGGRGAGYFGAMALVLGTGDLFHLIPRLASLFSGKRRPWAMGLGKWMASVSSTLYYILLLEAWQAVHGARGPGMVTLALWSLAAVRIVLCCMPQNRWMEGGSAPGWGIARNVPFLLMGGLLAGYFAVAGVGGPLRLLPLAVALSFAFYLPVVLFASRRPAVGMLMIPKTCAYLWVQIMGLWAVSLA